jgi:hypothetical protein
MNHNPKLYKSDRGEIKTLGQWIDFANRNGHVFACSSAHNKIKIVTKNILVEEVVRELTEFKLFKEKQCIHTS